MCNIFVNALYFHIFLKMKYKFFADVYMQDFKVAQNKLQHELVLTCCTSVVPVTAITLVDVFCLLFPLGSFFTLSMTLTFELTNSGYAKTLNYI